MSAVNASTSNGKEGPPGRDTKAAEKPSREPSMEEILASIRQIISGDQQLPLASRSAVLPPLIRPAPSTAATPPIRAKLQPPAGSAVRIPSAIEPPPPSAPVESENFRDIADAIRGQPAALDESPDVGHALAEMGVQARSSQADLPPRILEHEQPRPPFAFAPAPARLAKTEEHARSDEALLSATAGAQISSSFNTLATTVLIQKMPPIEELARDILRPILKSWLDDNLPVLVERLVRAEIERVARGGR